MPPLINKLSGAILDFLFPQKCIGCGKEGSLICVTCSSKLPSIPQPVCPKCGRHQINGITCPACIDWENYIDGIRSPFKFEGLIRDAVHLLKYKNLRDIANILSEQLFVYLKKYPLIFDVIIPVPLHAKRLKERGYNQSEILACKLGEIMNCSVKTTTLFRIKHTIPQVKTISLSERKSQISDAFICKDISVKGEKVLLIDDVSTSGATFDECAKALKSAGALNIWGLSLARDI